MIKITITKLVDQKLFDRMPLPRIRRAKAQAFHRQLWNLKSEPFIRKIYRIY